MAFISYLSFGVMAVLFASASCRPSSTGLKEGVICSGDTYVVEKDGQLMCNTCAPCQGGGLGWDERFVRNKSEHGFTNCYPCVKCPAGTYRTINSDGSLCLQCRLDCMKLYRYESRTCGGDDMGHCAGCFDGYTPSSQSVPNSLCTITAKEHPTETEKKAVIEQTSIITAAKPLEEINYKDEEKEKQSYFDAKNPFLISTSIAVFVLIVILGLVAWKYCSSRKDIDLENDPASAAQSAQSLLSHSSDCKGEENVETDGPAEITEKVRAEIQESVIINEEHAAIYSRSCNEKTTHNNMSFHNRILDKNDETLIVAAKGIHGEKRHELFENYLKLGKAQIGPEEEKWHKNIVSFPDYIHEVLKIWIKINGNKADLNWLIKALGLASFDDVVDKILRLPENGKSNTSCTMTCDKSVQKDDSIGDQKFFCSEKDQFELNNLSLSDSDLEVDTS